MADCLWYIGANVAAVGIKHGGEGKYISARYTEILHPPPQDDRSAGDIIGDMKAKIRRVAES